MKVGARICMPVKIDSTTSMASRGHFARVCVEIDLTKQLISREEEPVVSVVGGSAPSHAGARPNNRKEKRPNVRVLAQNQPAKPVGPQLPKDSLLIRNVTGKNNLLTKESSTQNPNRAPEHWVIRGNAKSQEITRERIRHVCDEQGLTSSRVGMTDIVSEHHQDPPACMEDSLAPNRTEPRVDNNGMVIEDSAWEKEGGSPTEEVGLEGGGQDRRTGMTQ